MNAKKIIIMLGGLMLASILSSSLQACIIIIETDIVEVVVVETKKEDLVCAKNCFDSAMAKVTCPNFGCNKSVVNKCPSEAECKAPRNPDGTRSASAKAYGNCFVPHRWTGWIVDSTSGCTADAKATANNNPKIINTTTIVQIAMLRIIWIPKHPFSWVTAFEPGAVGTVEITFRIEDPNHNLVMESKTLLNAHSPDFLTDTTGRLMWERFQFHDESTGEVFDNAFQLAEHQEPIILAEVPIVLGPEQEIELEYNISTQSRLLDDFGHYLDDYGHYPKPNKTAAPSTVPGPRIISKTVGIAGCLEKPVGDLDGDCLVNFIDVAILSLNWLAEGLPL